MLNTSSQPSRKTGAGTQIGKTIVTREVIKNRDAEIRKLNVIAKCGLANRFAAPNGLEADDVKKIVTNFVATEQRLADLFFSYVCQRNPEAAQNCLHCCVESGRVLAEIHKALSIACECNEEQIKKLEQSEMTVLHGDFGFSNLYLNAEMELVVFDPFPDFYSTFETWEIGPRTIDLGMIVSCMVGRTNPKTLLTMRLKRIPKLIKALIDSYNEHSKTEVQYFDVFCSARTIANSYFRQNTRGVKRLIGSRLWNRNFSTIKQLFSS